MRVAEGRLRQFRCESCARAFTHVTFIGENDARTEGLASASSRLSRDVAIIEAKPDEGATSIERRIAEALARDDFVMLNNRFEGDPPPAGLTFAEFRRAYRPQALILSSPCCIGAEAREDGAPSDGGVFAIGALRFRAIA